MSAQKTTNDRPTTPIGEVIDQMHDRRLSETGESKFEFMSISGGEIQRPDVSQGSPFDFPIEITS